MDDIDLAQCFAALSHPSRVAVLRLLLKVRNGVAVHDIADHLNVKQNAASFHLSVLARADIIVGHRVGRLVIYRILPYRLELMAVLLTQASNPQLAKVFHRHKTDA